MTATHCVIDRDHRNRDDGCPAHQVFVSRLGLDPRRERKTPVPIAERHRPPSHILLPILKHSGKRASNCTRMYMGHLTQLVGVISVFGLGGRRQPDKLDCWEVARTCATTATPSARETDNGCALLTAV